jgi:hypothetical protein
VYFLLTLSRGGIVRAMFESFWLNFRLRLT